MQSSNSVEYTFTEAIPSMRCLYNFAIKIQTLEKSLEVCSYGHLRGLSMSFSRDETYKLQSRLFMYLIQKVDYMNPFIAPKVDHLEDINRI